MIELTLPWPPKILSPNARSHWAPKAKAKKAYRQIGYLLACNSKRQAWVGDLRVWLTFAPPSRRHFDHDGLISRMKAGFDGIADALGIDDNRFRIERPEIVAPVKGGQVRVRIEQDRVRELTDLADRLEAENTQLRHGAVGGTSAGPAAPGGARKQT